MRTPLALAIFFALYINPAIAQLDTSEVFVEVESLPEPEGGWAAFYQFLGKEIKYPKADREAGIEGKAIIQFVIEPDGSMTNVQPFPGAEGLATPAMLEEAIRVIKLSPKWKPGTQGGEPVRCKYSIPVKFGLRGEPKSEGEDKRRWWQRKK